MGGVPERGHILTPRAAKPAHSACATQRSPLRLLRRDVLGAQRNDGGGAGVPGAARARAASCGPPDHQEPHQERLRDTATSGELGRRARRCRRARIARLLSDRARAVHAASERERVCGAAAPLPPAPGDPLRCPHRDGHRDGLVPNASRRDDMAPLLSPRRVRPPRLLALRAEPGSAGAPLRLPPRILTARARVDSPLRGATATPAVNEECSGHGDADG